MLVVGEIKEADQRTNTCGFELAALCAMCSPTNRRAAFVHEFTLTGTEMEIWVFNHSGPFSSTAFDIYDKPEEFIQALCGSLISDEELKSDTFTKQKDSKRFVTIPAQIGSKKRKRFELHPVPIASQ